MLVTEKTIPARDGFPLSATVLGDLDCARRIAVVSSATAVPRRFYRHYAKALFEAGYAVITYDYRGIGDSKPESLSEFPARMRDWALLDMNGVIDWITSKNSNAKLFLVGHSVGGQIAGLIEDSSSITAMLSVSAQSGYWKLQGGAQKISVAFHVYVTFPLLAAMLGYMPWSWFGTAEDLPGGVALEWARWCRNADYLCGDSSLPLDRYSQFTKPILAYSIADDNWGTAASVDALSAAYPTVERRHISPSDHGLSQLGHFGYFRKGSDSVWADGINWLESCG